MRFPPSAETTRLVDCLLAQLTEHFDAVQILATRVTENGETQRVAQGFGNWYARQGMAHTFVKSDEADTAAYALKRELRPEGD